MVVGFGSSSSINGSDKMRGCESLSLNHVRSIKDGALKFFHLAREEEALHDCVRPIENRRLRCGHASIEVHQVYIISTVITPQIDG